MAIDNALSAFNSSKVQLELDANGGYSASYPFQFQ